MADIVRERIYQSALGQIRQEQSQSRATISHNAYRVHLGYTAAGRNRWAYFDTIEDANAYCELVRARRGIILSVVAR